jgi:integrase
MKYLEKSSQNLSIEKVDHIFNYILHLKLRRKRAASTCKTYQKVLTQWLIFLSNVDKSVLDASETDVIAFLNKRKLANHTYNLYKVVLSGFYKYLSKLDLSIDITEEIFLQSIEKKIYKKPVSSYDIKVLWRHFQQKVDEAATSDKDRDLLIAMRNQVAFAIAATTGLRPMSMCELIKSDIVVLRADEGHDVAGLSYKPKGKEKQFVTLEAPVVELIEKYFNLRNDFNEPDFIICSYSNISYKKKMNVDSLRKIIIDAFRFCGVQKEINKEYIKFYSLRHTVGTNLTSKYGESVAQDVLGHSSRDSTRHYNKLARDRKLLSSPPSMLEIYGIENEES